MEVEVPDLGCKERKLEMLSSDLMERLEPVHRIYFGLMSVWSLDGVMESDAVEMAMLCVGRMVEEFVAECREADT